MIINKNDSRYITVQRNDNQRNVICKMELSINDAYQKDAQYNDTQYCDTVHNDTQHNDNEHRNSQHK